jgi:hypothetical protein
MGSRAFKSEEPAYMKALRSAGYNDPDTSGVQKSIKITVPK